MPRSRPSPSAPPPPRQLHRPPPHPRPLQNPVNEEELLHTMDEFANPLKKTQTGEYFDDGVSDGSGRGSGRGGSESDESFQDGDSDVMDNPDMHPDPGMHHDMHHDMPGGVEEERPSEGYTSIDEEKSDIMFKLQRLLRQGVKGIRVFTPYSDIKDMRSELTRVKTELELERSVKFQRKILMAIVSALEWGNTKFNPFDLELDGWSEQMHDSVQTSNEYDGIFEELYFKYRGKVSTPPEIRLLLMVGGSAMMFHMTKSMMKSALPNLGDIMKQNPHMMEAMMKGMQQQAHDPTPGPPPGPPTTEPTHQPSSPARSGRREMRGPGLDVTNIGGGLGGLGGGLGGLGNLGSMLGMGIPGMAGPSGAHVPPPPPPPHPALNPMATRMGTTKRGPTDVSEMSDAGSDRLSDVVSEDLQSLPDDFSDGEDRGVKRISVGSRKPKKQKIAKKVITL